MENVKSKRMVKRILITVATVISTLVTLCVIIFVGLMFWTGTYQLKYSITWIMGKTYTEIIDMYGEFDFINGEVSENGIFSNGEAAYVISED